MSELPFVPYEGPEPYIFVSYAHANKDKVYPIIKQLHEMGYRLWFDEGIEAGDKWFKVISDHLRRSACMMLFWSPEAEKSQWVGKEILIALSNDIRIVGSIINSATVPDELVDVQLLFHENYDSDDTFLAKLCRSLPPVHNAANNTPPSIDGQDKNLGFITAPPTVCFTVTDPDPGDSVDVTVLLDGKTVEQMTKTNVTLGQMQEVTLSKLAFFGCATGQHTMQIVATDRWDATATRTYTFSRNVTTVEMKLNPVQTDKAAKRIEVSLEVVADPANVELFVCNNALDAVPTWEPAPNGSWYSFTNTVSTSGTWAISVWVRATPSDDYPSVSVSKLSFRHSLIDVRETFADFLRIIA